MKISLLITGSMSALSLPGILFSLRVSNPDWNFTPYLTQSATRIITPESLATLSGIIPRSDEWGDLSDPRPKHIQLEQESDAFLIAPASLHFIARFINHDCSSPFSLALQCTKKPIFIVPCLPPGGIESVAYLSLNEQFSRWKNVQVLQPVQTASASTPGGASAGFGSSRRLIDFLSSRLQDI